MNAPGPYRLKIYVHVFREDDGTGGITEEEVREGLDTLYNAYDEHNIFFQWDCNVNYIDNTSWFNHNNPGQEFFQENNPVFTGNFHTDGIDLFIFPDYPNPGTISPEGLAKSLPGTALLTKGNYPDTPHPPYSRSHILSHEMGHCLGLLHTHHHTGDDGFPTSADEDYRTLSELADGSNCEIAGDCVCDTPADPRLSGQIAYPDCTWYGNDPDSLGNPMSPSVSNIMSYSHPSCYTVLTAEQGRRARNMIATQEILQACLVQEVISTSQTWDINNTPGGVYVPDGDICVESGATLTIESGITVKFGPGSRLVIKPGAAVYLHGTLTNNPCGEKGCNELCGPTWKGVEVWGNSNQHQYVQNGSYYQGRLVCRDGALIENAEIAVQLWGPTPQNHAGGIIHAHKTTFKNNLAGLKFAPYSNFSPGTGNETRYAGTLAQCEFLTDSDYPHESNAFVFVNMVGVREVSIRGCEFINQLSNPAVIEDISSFGYGIASYSSGARIISDCAQPIFPCPSFVKNRFEGLGYGIYAGKLAGVSGSNYLIVEQAEFEDCYRGIVGISIPSAVIIGNDMTLGTIPNSSLDIDQVGMSFQMGISNLNVQENSFTQPSPNPNLKTIGVNCFGLGVENNLIRKNSFDGLTIGNEAGGNNANISEGSGLLYQCNTNTNNTEYDFVICYDGQLSPGKINPEQMAFDQNNPGLPIASGNQFSNTGIPSDRDFSNPVVATGFNLNYYHKLNGGTLEVPDEYTGIETLIDADENTCPSLFCLPPCNTELEIAAIKDDFFEHRASRDTAKLAFQAALSLGDTLLAAQKYTEMSVHRQLMDNASERVLIHAKVDTVSYSLDTVRNWLALSEKYNAEIELALSYFDRGDLSGANAVLTNIPQKFNLNAAQVSELSGLQSLLSNLHGASVLDLSEADLNTLKTLAENEVGWIAGLARNIRRFYGLDHPLESCFHDVRSALTSNVEDEIQAGKLLKLYPNPANTAVEFELLDKTAAPASLSIVSITGRVIHRAKIQGTYTWNTALIPAGLYFYHLQQDGRLLQSGRIIIQH